MNSILEVSKEGITIHEIPLEHRVSTRSDEWSKIPDRSISQLDSNIQFRLVDGKSLMVYLLDKTSKIKVRGVDHQGPKTVLVPHNEKIVLETGHSLRLSINIKEDKRIFSKATIFQADLPGLKIDGIPVVFNSQDDAVEIVDTAEKDNDVFLDSEADEIEIDQILKNKAELNKMYYAEDEDLPNEPPPVEEIKSDKELEDEAIDNVIELSETGLAAKTADEVEVDDTPDDETDDETDDEAALASSNPSDALEMVDADEDEFEIDIDDDEADDEAALASSTESNESNESDLSEELNDELGEQELLNEMSLSENTDADDDDLEAALASTNEDMAISEEDLAFSDTNLAISEVESELDIEDINDVNEAEMDDDEAALASLQEAIEEDDTLLGDGLDIDPEEIEEQLSVLEEDEEVEDLGLNIEMPVGGDEAALDEDETDPNIEVKHPKKNLKFDSLPDDFFDDNSELESSDEADLASSQEEFEEEKDLASSQEEEFDEDKTDPNIEIPKTDDVDFASLDETDETEEWIDESETDSTEDEMEEEEEEDMASAKKKKSDLDLTAPEDKVIVFDDQTGTQTETEFFNEDLEAESDSNEPSGLYPVDETIQYDEMEFEKPEDDIIEEKEKTTTASRSSEIFSKFTKIFKRQSKNYGEAEEINDDQNIDDEDSTNSEINEFNEFDGFKSKRKIRDAIVGSKNALIGKIRKLFHKDPKINLEDYADDEEYTGEIDPDEMSEAQNEAEEIENSLVKNFGKEIEELDEADTTRGIKKEREDLVKAAKKSKKKHAQDPRPGVPARLISLLVSAFIVFNLNFLLTQHGKYHSMYIKHVDKKFVKLENPIKNGVRKIGGLIQKKAPSSPPEIKKYAGKIFKTSYVDTLFDNNNHRYLSMFLIFEFLCLLIFGNSFPLFLFGARNDKKFLISRGQAVLRFILWPLTIALPILDLPLLFGRRSFREIITRSYITYPSVGLRNLVMFMFLPVSLVCFFLYPYVLNLSLFSSIDVANSKYDRINLNEMEYSKVLDISIKPKLKAGYIFIPFWSVERNKKLTASLQIYSIKTNQSAMMRKYKSIDFVSIIKTAAKKDPFFLKNYPELEVFVSGRIRNATLKSYQAMNDLITKSIKFSATNVDALKDLYKTGPYVQDNIYIKKEFLKRIESDGIDKIVIHTSRDENTIEIIPSKQAGKQTSYFVTFKGKENHVYSLTYLKKAKETRAEITKLALNQINFNEKASTPTENEALKTLEAFKNLVDPSYTKEDAYREVFEYYYSLGKLSLESNQKKFIDLAKEEIYRTGDLIGKLNQDPKLSQKYKERFRNLSKALETLDARYFSM